MLFTNEKLTTDKPFVERAIPENPVWMAQPEPGQSSGGWLHRTPSRRAQEIIPVVAWGLAVAAFICMAVLA